MDKIVLMEKMKTVLANILVIDENDINENSLLIEDLGAESIDIIDIIFSLSKEFNIDFERKDIYPDRKILSTHSSFNN